MPMYSIHNAVRGRANRAARAAAPTAHRLTQRILPDQRRLLRSRPHTFTEAQVMEHLEELKAKVASGAIEVRDEKGQLVDLETMRPMVLATKSVAVSPPTDAAPVMPFKIGEDMPLFQGGDPMAPGAAQGPNLSPPFEEDSKEWEPAPEPTALPQDEELSEMEIPTPPPMPSDIDAGPETAPGDNEDAEGIQSEDQASQTSTGAKKHKKGRGR
jgi:hypothetical protein